MYLNDLLNYFWERQEKTEAIIKKFKYQLKVTEIVLNQINFESNQETNIFEKYYVFTEDKLNGYLKLKEGIWQRIRCWLTDFEKGEWKCWYIC